MHQVSLPAKHELIYNYSNLIIRQFMILFIFSRQKYHC